MDSQTDVATTSVLNTKHKSLSRKKRTENGNEMTIKTSAAERKNTAQRKKIMKFRNIQIDDEDARKAAWTVRDKTALLKAMRKYGWKKIDKITAEMPTKTRDQIEYFIHTRKRQTRYLLAAQAGSTKFPIELWLEKAKRLMARKPNYSKALPEALGLISKFENHDAVFGPNCESLYGFFQGLLNGELPKELNAFESKVMLHLIKALAALLRHLPLEEITKELNNPVSLINRNDTTRTYSSENREASVSNQASQNHVKSPKEYVADLYDDINHSSDMIQDENIPVSEVSISSNRSSESIHVNSESQSTPHHSRETEEEPKSPELFSINPLSIPISLLKKTYVLASNIPLFKD